MNKGTYSFMNLTVSEADFKEAFYLNPNLGYNTVLCIGLDENGLKLKLILESMLAYMNLVLSKATLARISELNSKTVSFYQENMRGKLVLDYLGDRFKGLKNQGVDSLFFKSFKLHNNLETLEIHNMHLTKDAI